MRTGGRHMDFYQKYELIDPLPGEGTRSFRARQIATGREVTVHLLVGGRTPENERLLARLRGIPAQSFSKLVEVGENDGTPYVATAAPPYQSLADWLADQERGVAPDPHALDKVGTWRVPVMSQTGQSPQVAPAPPSAASQPGEIRAFSGNAQAAAALDRFDQPRAPVPPPARPNRAITRQGAPKPQPTGRFDQPVAPPAPPAASQAR